MFSRTARLMDNRLMPLSIPEFLSPIKTWNPCSARMFRCADAQSRGFWRAEGGSSGTCSLKMSRKCMFFANRLCSRGVFKATDPNYFLLPLLGSRLLLNSATGINGRVWIKTKGVKQTIVAARCIEAAALDSDGMDQNAIKKFINTLEL